MTQQPDVHADQQQLITAITDIPTPTITRVFPRQSICWTDLRHHGTRRRRQRGYTCVNGCPPKHLRCHFLCLLRGRHVRGDVTTTTTTTTTGTGTSTTTSSMRYPAAAPHWGARQQRQAPQRLQPVVEHVVCTDRDAPGQCAAVGVAHPAGAGRRRAGWSSHARTTASGTRMHW